MLSYIGPGGALSAIGSFLALLAATLLALLGFVWYPIKRMLRARKAKRASASADRSQLESSQVDPSQTDPPKTGQPQTGQPPQQHSPAAEQGKPLASTASENGPQV